MYIKLSLAEVEVTVPHCWGGVCLLMTNEPEIIANLPKGFEANIYIEKPYNVEALENSSSLLKSNIKITSAKAKMVQRVLAQLTKAEKNKTSPSSESDEGDAEHGIKFLDNMSDYYYDCGTASFAQIQEAIEIFKLVNRKISPVPKDYRHEGEEVPFSCGITEKHPKKSLLFDILTYTFEFIQQQNAEYCRTVGTQKSKFDQSLFVTITKKPNAANACLLRSIGLQTDDSEEDQASRKRMRTP